MAQDRIFSNRYELKKIIGSGGMAEVFLAHDSRLNRDVAVKVLRSTLTHDPVFITRFRKEAVASASLNDPNIVSVFDSGDEAFVDDKGNVVHQPFIVMEYINGKTLKDILSARGKLNVSDALEIMGGILKALRYSHSRNIIHRDIKPANIMITANGEIKVMDFGIARALEDASSDLTQGQSVVGTAQYFSPEQAKGEPVDARSDLYSAGCVLYEMVTGVPVFKGDSAIAVAYQHVQSDPVSPRQINPDLSPSVEKMILKSIQKNPKRRYQDAKSFLQDLDKISSGLEIESAKDSDTAPDNLGKTEVMTSVKASELQIQDTMQNVIPTAPDDDEITLKLSKKLKIGIIAGAGAVGLIVIGLLLSLLVFSNPSKVDSNEVEVPDLSKAQTSVQACKQLQDVQLICDLSTVTDATVAEGRFVKQSPLAGKIVTKNSVVKVYFSDGPDSQDLPNFEGKTESETKSLLEDLGLVVGPIKTEDSGSIDKGQVTRTEPVAGEKVSKGQTISIWLGTGNFKLPNLNGLTREEATACLAGINVQILFTEVKSSVQAGRVVEQTPTAGSVPLGSSVTLGISVTDDRVVIPSITGLDRTDAQNQLAQAGLIVLIQSEASTQVGSDRAIRTDPVAGSMVDKGSTVTLYISSGAPPSPSVT
jgi:serine/threonine-protein kinase